MDYRTVEVGSACVLCQGEVLSDLSGRMRLELIIVNMVDFRSSTATPGCYMRVTCLSSTIWPSYFSLYVNYHGSYPFIFIVDSPRGTCLAFVISNFS